MADITKEDVYALETLIDRVGLAKLAEAISLIAYEKQEHVQSNWQDSALAKTWARVGRRFGNLVGSLELVDDVLGHQRNTIEAIPERKES